MTAVCEILGVSRSGFYTWRDETETNREREDRALVPLVCEVFWRHKRRYGARRIAEELKGRGKPCGVARVAKLLKNQGLRAIQPKSFKPKTTDSRHTLGYSPNLLLNRAAPTQINEVWVGDITYIPLSETGFGYLALLMDLFSRRIVGWTFLEEMGERLGLGTLTEAIRSRQPPPGLIHHSDRGGQYAGGQFRGVLRRFYFKVVNFALFFKMANSATFRGVLRRFTIILLQHCKFRGVSRRFCRDFTSK